MMRYVVTVLMTIALVSVSMPVIDNAAADRSQKALGSELSQLQDTAEMLHSEEEVVRSSNKNPRRIMELEFPEQSFTSRSVQTVRITPHHDAAKSTITYAVVGREPSQLTVDAVIVGPNNETVELGGNPDRRFILELKRDDVNNRVVELRRFS